MTNNIDVSVIIVNYNTKELVDKCIDSIIKYTQEIGYEVIVIDNATYDGLEDVISKKYPDVKYIQNKENLGFGAANNIAVEKAVGGYLFLLNPDTYLKNNAIKLFYDFMEKSKDQNIGVTGALLMDQNDNEIHSFAHFKKPGKNILNKFRKVLKKALFIEKLSTKRKQNKSTSSDFNVKDVDYITGADMFIRRDLFLKVGGFNEKFFMYYEETELQKRLADINYKRVIINSPKIVHHVSASFSSKSSNVKRIMFNVSENKYMKIQYGILTGTLYKILFLFCSILDLVIDLYRREHTVHENIEFIKCVYKEKYLSK